VSRAIGKKVLSPFLKWAGGKRWLLQKYPELFANEGRLYIEPFLGGGAIFFGMNPTVALLADLNADLITTYQSVRSNWRGIWKKLLNHQRRHNDDPQYYYRVRNSNPRTDESRAAKFIYLNRTCFNGLYRVNLQGIFNVPKGTKDTVVFDDDDFEEVASRLKSATLTCSDFELVIDAASSQDFLFVDPPYTVRHNLNGFLKYNERIFSWADQERLAAAIRRFALRGGRAMVTNAAHSSVITLYGDLGEIHRIRRHSVLSADNTYRTEIEEIAVTVGYSVDIAKCVEDRGVSVDLDLNSMR
jgi:DNA adenine methylase